MSTYIVTVPPTEEQGSYKTTIRVSRGETKAQAALWDYNSARAHDGLPPVKKMPAGTKYTRKTIVSDLVQALEIAKATIERLQRHAPGSAQGTLSVIDKAIALSK